ncbi:MAG: condensation domain-containing protein, partial [Ktedonobacteraceae bacterium]
MYTSFLHDTVAREDIKVFPVSFAQQRLWFLDQLEPDSAAYNVPITFHLRGKLDVSVLESCLNAIVQRHEALRTTFHIMDGQPVQLIAPTLIVSLPVVDLRDLTEAERDAQILRLVTEVAHEPFNLVQGLLVRTTLLCLNEEEHVLLLTADHSVFDDWSKNVFIRELTVLYESFSAGVPSSLPDLPIQYTEYARQQRERVQGDVLATQLSYWKQQLSGAPVILQLPTDRPRPEVPTFEGAQQSLTLPKKLTEALQTLSRQEGVTLFMILLAAFDILLQRYTGQEDLVVGTSIDNRTQKEFEGLIGCFANSLALRSNVSGNPQFRELLVRVRKVCLEAYAHIDLPFEQLVEGLQQERDQKRLPIFDVMINSISTPPTIWELPGLTISNVQMVEPVAKFAMTLYVEAWEGDLSLRLVYQRMLFSPERIACILDQFQFLLEQIVASPEKPIQLYSLVTPESLYVLPDPHAVLPEPNYELITSTFVSWAQRTPEQPA